MLCVFKYVHTMLSFIPKWDISGGLVVAEKSNVNKII